MRIKKTIKAVFNSDDIKRIENFREFLSSMSDDEWNDLNDLFSMSECVPYNGLNHLFDLVDEFYTFAQTNAGDE